MTTVIPVRAALPGDIPTMQVLLNEIIRIGGTTAYEAELTEAQVAAHFVSGPDVVLCHVALDQTGEVAGFQALERRPDLPPGIPDIATFTRRSPRLRGSGRALFATTRTAAAAHGFVAINATIRADNAGGLAYYAKMGFRRRAVEPAVPLSDGTPVDRITMQFDLSARV